MFANCEQPPAAAKFTFPVNLKQYIQKVYHATLLKCAAWMRKECFYFKTNYDVIVRKTEREKHSRPNAYTYHFQRFKQRQFIATGHVKNALPRVEIPEIRFLSYGHRSKF